ncbi:MAG: cobalamin biosynthesis protein [Mogibacterium sp.]|nr:cobalamin biosynthesis protein [Mogibacterium sp.]
MRIKIIYFTDKGKALSERLKAGLAEHDAVIVPKGAPLAIVCGDAFVDNEALVFVGAAGIAVRAVAPLVRDKLKDPPVIVIDENGSFVIPLLSGHVGGANSLALEVADIIGAQPVITTATDVSAAFSVDLFAKENELKIANRDGIARVSSSALEGKPVTICIRDYPPEEPVDVLIAEEEAAKALKDSAKIVLCPKRYAIGIGCRRGKSFEVLRAFAEEVLVDNGIDIDDAGCIVTIDVKKDEEGLKRLSQAWRMPLITFEAGLLAKAEGDFSHSDTVLEKVGVDNVCERAAVLAAGKGSQLIIKKTVRDGMTIAVAERKI